MHFFQAVLRSADSSGWGFFFGWVGICITNNIEQPIANVITPCVDKSTVDEILGQFLRGKIPKLRYDFCSVDLATDSIFLMHVCLSGKGHVCVIFVTFLLVYWKIIRS